MKSALWHIIFGLFFVALVFKGTLLLYGWGRMPVAIAPWEFILLALATFRLTRLASYDVITKFVRDGVANARPDSFVGTFSALIHCPWCTGLWFASFVVFAYYSTVLAFPLILVLAVAGVASLFQVLANLVGWHAEGKKRSVLGPDVLSKTTCG